MPSKEDIRERPRLRTRCFKFSAETDDWAPPFRLNGWYQGGENRSLVEVSLLTLVAGRGSPSKTRVCVWGADDRGMERDFDGEFEARACFDAILALEAVTMKDLRARGFVPA